jgi:protein phosphatase
MNTFFFTLAGAGGRNNEDAILADEIYSGLTLQVPQSPQRENLGLLAVADGIGGGPGGTEAARLVLESLKKLDQGPTKGDRREAIKKKLWQAKENLSQLALKEPRLSGLGATVAGLWLSSEGVTVFNCGDCRVYLFKDKHLTLLSRDHSCVFYQYLAGLISYEQIRTHPSRRFVTGAVRDGSMRVELYTKEIRFQSGELFLICTDGVWESLDDGQIEESLSGNDPKSGAEELANRLKLGEYSDDSSFILSYF